ncbi:MAG: HAMP domain-containing histidine kinase [Chloroflexi bacterium]|nr:HAMP domain-containing histidine kinase [Chloroflexota bacterium]MCL5273172.1 HAMP domain-containing histidine kinase [Chloroflexota bacterium]
METNLSNHTTASLSDSQRLALYRVASYALTAAKTLPEGCQSCLRAICDIDQSAVSAGAIWIADADDDGEATALRLAAAWPDELALLRDESPLRRVILTGQARWIHDDEQAHDAVYVLPVRAWQGATGVLGLRFATGATPDTSFIDTLDSIAALLGAFVEHHQFVVASYALDEARKSIDETLVALARERELRIMNTRFITLVSHEFRTPMSIIQSSSELLERYYDRLSDEKRCRHFEQIRTSTMNMADMLQDILVLGRYDSGKTHFEPRPLDLAAYCRDCVEQIQQAYGHKYRLSFEYTGDYVPARMDDKLLWQIINNLLSNAIKYSLQPDPVVTLSLECSDSQAIMRFRDYGIGIPVEDQARLFEPFHRGSNVGSVPGTGLGMSIVQRAVHAHQGEIVFESVLNQGATFIVTLPLR